MVSTAMAIYHTSIEDENPGKKSSSSAIESLRWQRNSTSSAAFVRDDAEGGAWQPTKPIRQVSSTHDDEITGTNTTRRRTFRVRRKQAPSVMALVDAARAITCTGASGASTTSSNDGSHTSSMDFQSDDSPVIEHFISGCPTLRQQCAGRDQRKQVLATKIQALYRGYRSRQAGALLEMSLHVHSIGDCRRSRRISEITMEDIDISLLSDSFHDNNYCERGTDCDSSTSSNSSSGSYTWRKLSTDINKFVKERPRPCHRNRSIESEITMSDFDVDSRHRLTNEFELSTLEESFLRFNTSSKLDGSTRSSLMAFTCPRAETLSSSFRGSVAEDTPVSPPIRKESCHGNVHVENNRANGNLRCSDTAPNNVKTRKSDAGKPPLVPPSAMKRPSTSRLLDSVECLHSSFSNVFGDQAYNVSDSPLKTPKRRYSCGLDGPSCHNRNHIAAKLPTCPLSECSDSRSSVNSAEEENLTTSLISNEALEEKSASFNGFDGFRRISSITDSDCTREVTNGGHSSCPSSIQLMSGVTEDTPVMCPVRKLSPAANASELQMSQSSALQQSSSSSDASPTRPRRKVSDVDDDASECSIDSFADASEDGSSTFVQRQDQNRLVSPTSVVSRTLAVQKQRIDVLKQRTNQAHSSGDDDPE